MAITTPYERVTFPLIYIYDEDEISVFIFEVSGVGVDFR